jgi:hypothetical protein
VPLARYFMVVGSALTILLLIAAWILPESPESFPDRSEIIERATIRIRSEHKWPEKVVLVTSQPIIAPLAVEEPPAAQSAWLLPEEPGHESNLEGMAQLKPNIPSAAVGHPALQIKRGVARTARSKRVTRGPITRRGCCQFEKSQASSIAMSSRRAASLWPFE